MKKIKKETIEESMKRIHEQDYMCSEFVPSYFDEEALPGVKDFELKEKNEGR